MVRVYVPVYLYDELCSDEAKETALAWALSNYSAPMYGRVAAVEERMRVAGDEFYEDGSVA